MRKCPKCGKTYDDTWKVCLTCSTALSDNISNNEVVLPLKTHNKCLNCGKVTTEKLIRLSVDGWLPKVCKSCAKRLEHLSAFVGLSAIVFMIAFVAFSYLFPYQFFSMIAFFEKLFK